MNHPAEDWRDDETFKLSKDKERFLDRDIRFANLGDAEDHRRCFEWEYIRTRIFKGQEFGDEIFKQMFPFHLKSFPEKPYKSHDPKQRATWVDVIGANYYGKSMHLLSGSNLVTMFNQLADDQRKEHLMNGLLGDYSTPTCPRCNQKMVRRTASRGKSAGSSFWGCANYPRCKQTFKMV